MITEVTFYGGPHHLKTFVLKKTPPRIRIETDKILGIYRFNESGAAGPEYVWTRPVGQYTKSKKEKIDRAFPEGDKPVKVAA